MYCHEMMLMHAGVCVCVCVKMCVLLRDRVYQGISWHIILQADGCVGFFMQINLMHSSCSADRDQCKMEIEGQSESCSCSLQTFSRSHHPLLMWRRLPSYRSYSICFCKYYFFIADGWDEKSFQHSVGGFLLTASGCQSVKPAMKPASPCLKELPAQLKAFIREGFPENHCPVL